MSADQFHGIVPALITPFTAGGEAVALDRIPPHLRFIEEHGAHGVLALGTNGEFSALTFDEKREVCDTVLAHRGSLFVIVGVNVCALPEAIQLARHAEAGGADALLVAPPFYFPNLRLEGLLNYYKAIFEAVTVPIFLYNIPSYTKITIEDDLIEALSAFPHLAGLKDTSLSIETTRHYIERFPALRIFCGNDSDCGAAVAAGAAGSISASANVVPDWMRAIYEAARAGEDWQAVQERIDAYVALGAGLPPRAVTKALLAQRGGPASAVRPPLTELSAAEHAALLKRATTLGFR